MRLFVGNVLLTATKEDLRQLLETYGRVLFARISTDRVTGRPRGFGFVVMPNTSEAQAAIAALHGTSLEGRPLTVNQAKPREKRGIPRRPRWEGTRASDAPTLAVRSL